MWKSLSQDRKNFFGEKFFDDCDIVIKKVVRADDQLTFIRVNSVFIADILSKDAHNKFQATFVS